jgi:hypothetical protein
LYFHKCIQSSGFSEWLLSTLFDASLLETFEPRNPRLIFLSAGVAAGIRLARHPLRAGILWILTGNEPEFIIP